VVPAFGRQELASEAVYVEVADCHGRSPPSPAFAPKALHFRRYATGALAGVVEVEPAPGAAAKSAVTFYRLDFADAAGKLLGEGHLFDTTGTSAVRISLSRGELPVGATQLIVRAGNAAGLGSGRASAALNDTAPAAAPPKPRRLAPSLDDSEPWLRPPQHAHSARTPVWPPPKKDASGAPSAQASPPRSGRRILCTVTLPGLEAHAVGPELRKALTRAFAAGLPHVEEGDVRVTQVMAAAGAGGGAHWPPRSKGAARPAAEQKGRTTVVQFEVEAAAGARANALDRVEARLILLGQGGTTAGHFGKAFLTALGRTGVRLPKGTRIERVEVGEPQQVMPRKVGRHLSAAPNLGVLGSEDEEAEEAALDATTIAGAAAALCVAFVVVTQRRRAAAKVPAEMEGVKVQVEPSM